MKLSAPPPPPPPPGDENPGASAPGAPDSSNTPAAAPPAPETPEAPPAPAPKPLKWPGWFSGVDGALVGLVLVFTFAVASFAARNSDVWLHLAAGKRLLAGEYTPGTDPFSYSAGDRAWVNHSWLLDAVAYLLYGGKGVVLNGAKALAVVLAIGVLIAIRRPRFPLWPWAAVGCVAALAAAPQFSLRPIVASILFLSVTMYLLFRLPQKANSWRFPIAVGITFWLWANCDQWFFLGPLALALVLVGELIQAKLFNSPESSPADGIEEPLGRFPDLSTLAKALGVGVLACMLNPHHVRVWELPLELLKPAIANDDPWLRSLLYSPLDSVYRANDNRGYNLNGLAYAVLLVSGAALLGFGPGRVRLSHVVLWVGFAALSLWSVYAIPFLAIITMPLVAAQLNAFSAGIELKSWGDPRTRLVFIGSSVGRFASVLAVVALCVIAYPGWTHPEPNSSAYARRVAWDVEAEPALVRAAEQFKAWRESGKLPTDARGFVTSIELANYLAWFAPQEKVFLNGRFNHHRRELADFVAVRRGLGLFQMKDEVPKQSDATEVLRTLNADYVAIHGGPGDGPTLAARAADAISMLYRDADEWSPWYVDGRTTVFGWRPAGARASSAFASLRVDPVVLALGPNVEPLPNEPPTQPLKPLGWEEPFVRPARPAPVEVAETIGWLRFKIGPAIRQDRRQLIRERIVASFFFGAPATSGTAHGFAVQVAGSFGLPFAPTEATDPGVGADATAMRAIPLLALRAARRAIAKDPDHPDGYYALAVALSDPELPLTESERTLGRVIALRQCLSRMPPPERYKRGEFTPTATSIAIQLVGLYLGQPVPGQDPRTGRQVLRGYTGMPIDVAPLNERLGQVVLENTQNALAPLMRVSVRQFQNEEQLPRNVRAVTGNVPHFLALDAARETLILALQYLPIDAASDPPDEAKRTLDGLEGARKEIDAALIRANEKYGQAKTAGANLPVLVIVALESGLADEALKLLNDPNTDLTKEYKEHHPASLVLWVSLALALGKVEDASDLLKELDTAEWSNTFERTGHARAMGQLRYQKALHAGQYKTAGEVLEGDEGRQVGVDTILAELAKNKVSPSALWLIDFAHTPTLVGGHLPALTFRFGLQETAGRAFQARDVIAAKLQIDARYFYRRGMVAVLEGDIPAAKRWFQQSVRKPPAGWYLSEVVYADARRYLRLIEFAEAKAR